jgi:serine/threonine protein kinase
MIQDDIGGSYEKVNRGNASSVGCYYSLARFYLAECVDALEYMHKYDSLCLHDECSVIPVLHQHHFTILTVLLYCRSGITHRDLKPENMMITAAGHLKLVDFGTCKDLRQTDLNGQEFVGTAEYMAPEVVDSEVSK